MNKRDLITAVAEHTEDFARSDVEAVLNSFEAVVTATVSSGEPVMWTGFCKFIRRDAPARQGRNPQTGETIQIKAKRTVRITPLKKFKDAVLAAPVAKSAKKKGR